MSKEREELKTKIKTVIVDHLTTLGYPNIPLEQIMQELKPMYRKLEEAGLIQSGMSFAAFVQHANHAFTFEQLKRQAGF